MAMTDADRPEDEGKPEQFADGEPIGGNDAGEFSPAEPLDDQLDQLELVGDDDTSLPWLEGDSDFDEEGSGGGQMVMLALLALSALALIVGGIWWFTRGQGGEELIADGSVIEAPVEPYKEKPDDPGGKTFEGTGDTSYAVSEGETRTAQLGDGKTGKDAPKPGFESVGAASSPSAKPAATAGRMPSPSTASQTAAASAAVGPGVQVGAYSSRAAAEAGWSRLTAAHSSLSGLKYRVVEGKADIGTVYRLQAIPGDAAAARALCDNLKAANQDCAIKN